MLLCYTLLSVQSLSHVQLFATPWTAACQASLSITNAQTLNTLDNCDNVMDHMDYVGQFLFLNGKNQLQIFEALAFTILILPRDQF